MFTTNHFIWIGLCAALVLIMSLIAKKYRWSLKQAGIFMTCICAVSEFSKVMSDMVESPKGGMHLDPLSLPFHLCSLMILLVLYITFGAEGKKRQMVINFVSVMGTLGSICAILIPTNGVKFTKVGPYQCFVYHGALLWFGLFMLFTGAAKLTFRALLENIGMLYGLAFIMLYVNGALSVYDTNFFYLTRPPMENLPILNLDQGWYMYLLRMLGLATVVLTAFQLPFILKKKT